MRTTAANIQREKAHRLIRRVSTDPIWDRARRHCGGLYLLRVALEEGRVLPIEADLFLIEGEYNPPEEEVRRWLRGRPPVAVRNERLRLRVVQGGRERRRPQGSLLLDSLYDSPSGVSRPANHFVQDPLSDPTEKQRTRAARFYSDLPTDQWRQVTRYIEQLTGQADFALDPA